MLTNISVRQQHRTEDYRVESLTYSSVLVSADIFNNGRVELFESSAAGLVNTSGSAQSLYQLPRSLSHNELAERMR
ncbi:hypothetical protein [Nitrosospira lacus]|nr:hypothetical protein [Nitrosospira lacus]